MARILHVEDSDAWRRIVRARLRGHEVDSATSPEEAIDYLQAGASYDVAIIDLHLRTDSDGLGGDILDLLRARYPSTRRIVVTGSPPGGSLRMSIFERFDVDDIIIKRDIDTPDLRRVIESAVAQEPGGLPQALKLRRSALRQRFRDWQQALAERLRSDVRVAEEHLYDAGRVSVSSRKRAQTAVDEARAREAEFRSACEHVRALIAGIHDDSSLEAAVDSLDAAEERFAATGGDVPGQSAPAGSDQPR